VARGGRPCRLQVAPVRLLPPRGPSRAIYAHARSPCLRPAPQTQPVRVLIAAEWHVVADLVGFKLLLFVCCLLVVHLVQVCC
jgi:hypothetical protein